MAKFTLKELRQKRRAGEKLGPKQLARLENAKANKPAPKPAPKPNKPAPKPAPKPNKPSSPKFTIKQLEQKQAAGQQLGPKQLNRLNKAQGALATGPKPTNKKPKFTIAELQQKQAAGGKLGPKQMARLERAGARNQPAGNINPKTGKTYKFTLEELQAKQAAGEELGPLQQRRLRDAGLYQEPSAAPAPGSAPAPTPPPIQTLAPEQQFERVGGQASSGIEQFMQQIQQQGAFQPGNYQDMMNQAYQNVMNQFEMTQGPQFQREQAQFQQMAAERGLDPNSEAYKTMQQQLNQRQDFARQSAMAQAQQQAQAVQAQGFNQALQQYQSPTAMLGAYQPFYQQFGQQQQFGTQTELQRQQMEQQAALAREEMANRLKQQQISAGATIGAAQAGNFGKLTPEQQYELQRMRNEGAIRLEEIRQGTPFEPLPESNSGYNYMQGASQAPGQFYGR